MKRFKVRTLNSTCFVEEDDAGGRKVVGAVCASPALQEDADRRIERAPKVFGTIVPGELMWMFDWHTSRIVSVEIRDE